MQSAIISTAGVFPDSTTVKAYLVSQVPDNRAAGPGPIGASVAEAATATGTLTLAGLEEGKQYILAAKVSEKWVYEYYTVQVGTESGLAEVVAANTITLPPGTVIKVTGNTEIKKITAGNKGKRVTLLFTGTPKVVDGENLKLAANFEATADDTLNLVCDGVNWYGAGTSVN